MKQAIGMTHMVKSAISMLLALACTALGAATNVWTGAANDNDWTNPENYAEKTVPGAKDTVVVGNTTVYLSDSDMASLNLAASLAVIWTTNANSTVEFTIDGETPFEFPAQIRWSLFTAHDRRGKIVKKGAGKLLLTDNTHGYGYAIDIDVQAGILSLEKAGKSTNSYYGDINVAEGALFYTRSSGRTCVYDVTGTGTVSNRTNYAINIMGGTADKPMTLNAYAVGCAYYSSGKIRIMRTDNQFNANNGFAVLGAQDGGFTEFYAMGMKNSPSSIGFANPIRTAEGGGTLRYLGDGNETGSDKGISVWYAKNYPSTFDAGAYGGLTLTGNWEFGGYTSGQGMGQLVLCGSNTHEMVLAGSIKNATITNANGKTGFAFHITKRGSGTWRLTDVSDSVVRENWTGLAVEEGTLRYDSIAETNVMCSLGIATNTQEAYCGTFDAGYTKPYAFRLGSAAAVWPADNLATFEYTGATQAVCETRPIALGGDAKLLNTSSHPFRFSGVTALSNGVSRLVLDGTGTNDEIQNLTDGAAGCRLGVVKTGTGTWTLGGTNSFSGPVVVKGGTLKVRREYQYTWYKLVVKDLLSRFNTPTTDSFRLGRIGLFDASGYRHNIGLAKNATMPIGFSLAKGEIGLASKYGCWVRETYDTQGLPGLVLTGELNNNRTFYMSRSGVTIDPGNSDTWIDFVMRLTNGTPEIAYYDLGIGTGLNSSDSNLNVRAWTMMGSTDGWHWHELHSVADSKSSDPDQKLKLRSNSWSWMAQNTVIRSSETAATQHDTFKLQAIDGHLSDPPPMPLANAEYVSVSDGGVLEAEGNVTLSRFRVDVGSVAGTIRGFKLADQCTIDVTGIPSGATVLDVPIAFEGVSPESAAWTTLCDGETTSRYKVAARAGRLLLLRRGAVISFR